MTTASASTASPSGLAARTSGPLPMPAALRDQIQVTEELPFVTVITPAAGVSDMP